MPGVSVETVSIPLPDITVQSPSRRGEQWRMLAGQVSAAPLHSTLDHLVETLTEEVSQMRQEPNPGVSWAAEDERNAGLTLADAAEALLRGLRRRGVLTAVQPKPARLEKSARPGAMVRR